MKGELTSAGEQTMEFVWKRKMIGSASEAQYNNCWGGGGGNH